MEKKGVEIGMNLIIVAVIALLVLVIVVYLIADKTGGVSDGMKCVEAQGSCKAISDCEPSKQLPLSTEASQSCSSGEICCKIIG